MGLKAVVSSHSSSEYVLVLEEGLMLSPDFFAVMASLLPLLSDPNAMAVAGWNPNGKKKIKKCKKKNFIIVTWKKNIYIFWKVVPSYQRRGRLESQW